MIETGIQNKKVKFDTKIINRNEFLYKPQNGENEVAKWAKENKAAIKEYNERIKKYGAFSDSFRSF